MKCHYEGSTDCAVYEKEVARAGQHSIVLLTTVLFLGCLLPHSLSAQLGSGFITIDPPQSGFTIAFGINDHGKVVGTYYDATGGHGFLRKEDGGLKIIDNPEGKNVQNGTTEARGINSKGLIVGDYCAAPPCDGVSVIKGYILTPDGAGRYDNDDFKNLETPGHINSYLQHINSEGDIVGCEHDTDTMKTMHGILREDSEVRRFPTPASMNNGINDRGEIVGYYTDLTTGISHGYLLKKGSSRLIDFPGAVNTSAWDINNRGQIVGTYGVKDGSAHGFLWQKGKFTSVDIPGALSTHLFGINSEGSIVGVYFDANTAHGFLLPAKKDQE